MPRPEEEAHRPPAGEKPLGPFELPPELADFLRHEEYAMVTHASDQGAVFVVKAPGAEIASCAGRVPVQVTHELHQHPLAPVIRTVVTIYDQPERPLALETFINVAEEDQWADYASLADQDELVLIFYDEGLSHQLTKHVGNSAGEQMSRLLNYAGRVKASIPADRYDFDRAKADVMTRTRL